MENKDLNNGSQENEWDEVIRNLNKKRDSNLSNKSDAKIKSKVEETSIDSKVEQTMNEEINAILEAKKLERLAIKIELEKEARALAQKNREEQEAKQIKIQKKYKAEESARLKQQKEAIKFLDGLGYENYKFDKINKELQCIQVKSTRHLNYIINRKGKVLVSGDFISHGDNGFFYVDDVFRKTCTLYHYDIITEELTQFTPFSSEAQLFTILEHLDPGKLYGFTTSLPDYRYKKPIDIESINVKSQIDQFSKAVADKQPQSSKSIEDEFRELFGDDYVANLE
jgi:hypothetical protein